MDGGRAVVDRLPVMDRPVRDPVPWKRLCTLLLWGMTLFVLLTFHRHGISNDELVQHTYGDMLWRYYASGLTDVSLFSYRNLFLYGGLFDLPVVALSKLMPSVDIWALRHLLSGLTGVLGMVGAGRLATCLAGPRTGFVAVLLLGLSGIWSGAMFTHTKDIPFAVAMIWGAYGLTRIIRYLPHPPLSLVLGFGLVTGLALGLRVGGLLLVFYTAVIILVCGVLRADGWRDRILFWARSVLFLLPGLFPALALMAFFWPWSVQSVDNVALAISAFSHFSFDMETILFGTIYRLDEIPRTYLPGYLLVKMPELMLLGLACACACGFVVVRRRTIKSARVIPWLPVLMGALFPVTLAIVTNPPLYNGVRHFLFVLPPLSILAAFGLCTTLDRVLAVRSVVQRGCFLAGFCSVFVLSAASLVMIHPYGYVSYNLLAGGLAGAAGRWEMDYWSSSLKDALAGLRQYVPEGDPGVYRVAVCAELVQADAVLGPRFHVVSDWAQADFFVSATQMGCDAVMEGDIVFEVRRLGVPLAVVKDLRPGRASFAGHAAAVR